ncbi:MAG: nicotinate phosphoribosyltransferase [Solirubrobacteraceae bacterium]
MTVRTDPPGTERTGAPPARPPILPAADPSDPGLLSPAEAGLLVDQYELTMAASYLAHDMNDPAVFELFVRHLPARRRWLLVAGLGPTLSLVRSIAFGERELAYLAALGFGDDFLDYLSHFAFSGDVDAMPEGTIAFANEPLLRVTAPRIEAQLLETLLLNQLNFQTMVATKAARIVLAAGGGRPGAGARLIDFSPRRDHGTDAAMKAARCAAIAGAGGTSNVAAAMRYGLRAVGTMAHSYVMSFDGEEEAFRTFARDFPEQAVMLVDTYDTLDGVRHAIAAARATGVRLAGVRLDSGDLLDLSRRARALLDAAGMPEAQILASGDLEERRIAELVAAGAPIDAWGVGTDLGTSRDSPTVNGVYKLVADRPGGRWRGVWKRSPEKATVPGAKQVFRRYADGVMHDDLIAMADEAQPGEPLLIGVVRGGRIVHAPSMEQMRERAAGQLAALPAPLRALDDATAHVHPVAWSERCRAHLR